MRCVVYYEYTNIGRCIYKHNDSFNERTNTVLYEKYTSPTLLWKAWCFLCVRGELETGIDCYILTPSSSNHSSTSFAFWQGCSTGGHWGPKPSVWSWSSLLWHPISNWNWLPVCVLVIFLFDSHVLRVEVRICHHHRIQPRPQVKVIFRYLRTDAPVSLFFRLFTEVHLLIDGSVEGQYITDAQTGSSGIWTQIVDFIFDDDKRYTPPWGS